MVISETVSEEFGLGKKSWNRYRLNLVSEKFLEILYHKKHWYRYRKYLVLKKALYGTACVVKLQLAPANPPGGCGGRFQAANCIFSSVCSARKCRQTIIIYMQCRGAQCYVKRIQRDFRMLTNLQQLLLLYTLHCSVNRSVTRSLFQISVASRLVPFC